MKQVWLLNHYAQEPGGAGGTRHFHLAKHLKAFGWQATVIAASVDHGTGRQRLAEGEAARFETIKGVPFLWVSTPTYAGNGVDRVKNMLAYSSRVLLAGTTSSLPKPHVVVGSSVHLFAAVSGALLARRHRVPFVFEVRDLWPQTLVDLGRLKDTGLITRLLRWLELWLYRRAEKIVVLLPNAVDYIVPLGIAADKVVWIPNGVELNGHGKPSPPDIRKQFTLMYFGAHGQANGLDCVLGAMVELSKRPNLQHVRLRLIGDGPLKSELMTQASQLNLTTVFFEDPVPKTRIRQLASEADAFVVCVKDLPRLYKYGISMNKIFDYLAASRPIIMASGAANDPVQDAGAGFTVKPESSFEMAEAIEKLVKLSPDQRTAMGKAGRAYAEKNHSFSALALKFAEVLEQLGKEVG